MRTVLLIGGTGTISTAVTRRYVSEGWDVTVLNRGNRNDTLPREVHVLSCDVWDPEARARVLKDRSFDTVCQFIGFIPAQVEADIRFFAGRCGQYMYISSASAYHKPCPSPFITESTSLVNPYWQYSRDKIACEELLMRAHREDAFPCTIIRPSHTYSERSMPVGVHGKMGSWAVLRRMMQGRPILIHGDGTSLWTVTWNEDFAMAFVGLSGNPHAVGECFHITSDETLTWNQIHQVIADALHVPLRAVHVSSEFLSASSDYDYSGSLLGDKAESVIFDNAKVKRFVPGFQATTRFDQGARKVLDYVLNHPEAQVEDPAFDHYTDEVIAALESAVQRVRSSLQT